MTDIRRSSKPTKATPIGTDQVSGFNSVGGADVNFTFTSISDFVKTTIGNAVAGVSDGLMSKEDKTKVNQYPSAPGVTDRVLISNGSSQFILVDVSTLISSAGATLNADTDLSSNLWFLDEDDMISNDPTKAPSQQSVNAFLQTHKDNLTVHRTINDSGNSNTDLLSAEKILDLVAAVASGVDVKDAVSTSTKGLGAITLSGEQTINGATTLSSRVIVTEQGGDENTPHVDNGIYVSSAGAWARASDADDDADVTNGMLTIVLDENSTRYREKYVLITGNPITVDTTPLEFVSVPALEFGTTAGTACEGNDPRLIDNISLGISVSDEITPITVGPNKITFRMPHAMTLTGVRASVTGAPTGSGITADINEGGVSVLSTKLTIDVGEKTSETASIPPVISDSALADDAEITIDIDAIGSTSAGEGLKIWLLGTRP